MSTTRPTPTNIDGIPQRLEEGRRARELGIMPNYSDDPNGKAHRDGTWRNDMAIMGASMGKTMKGGRVRTASDGDGLGLRDHREDMEQGGLGQNVGIEPDMIYALH